MAAAAAMHCLFHAPPLANYAREPCFSEHLNPRAGEARDFAVAFAKACVRYWDEGDDAAAAGVPCPRAETAETAADVVRAALDLLHRALDKAPKVDDASRAFPFRGDRRAWASRAKSLVAETFMSQVRRPDGGLDHAFVLDVDAPSVERHLATVDFAHAPPVLVLALPPRAFVSYDVVFALGDRRYALFAVLLQHDDDGFTATTALRLREGEWTHVGPADEPAVVSVNDVIQRDAAVLMYKAL